MYLIKRTVMVSLGGFRNPKNGMGSDVGWVACDRNDTQTTPAAVRVEYGISAGLLTIIHPG